MQVKQKASNRYVSEIAQTITRIMKNTLCFVFIGLGLHLPVFVIVLKAFLSKHLD